MTEISADSPKRADPREALSALRLELAARAEEEEEEDGPKSTSSAMPDLSSPSVPRLKAQVHGRLSPAECAAITLDSLHFRPLKAHELEETIHLHMEWFPVTYDDAFYSKCMTGEIFTLAAVYPHVVSSSESAGDSSSSTSPAGDHSDTYEELLGIVTMSTSCEYHAEDIQTVLGADCASQCQSWQHDPLTHSPQNGGHGSLAYILTLGVIDGFRRRGLAQELLRRSIDYVNKEWPFVKAVYLHVVTYNTAAIYLYESMQFLQIERFQSFYRLHGKFYDSFLYARYVHGAGPSLSWRIRNFLGPKIAWLRSALTSLFGPGAKGALEEGEESQSSQDAPAQAEP
mmetsp:Transcript_60610/g.112443  ORF Transcript_60610/g.112443 Transcript_60610/m.112443 type:complete len:343 (-) Transcript_60610:82-1110(-)